MSKKNALMDEMDAAAIELLKSVNGTTIDIEDSGGQSQPVDIKGRVAAFEAVTAYLAVKHKIEPTGARASGIDRYRTQINGSTPGRGGRSKTGAEDAGGAADAED